MKLPSIKIKFAFLVAICALSVSSLEVLAGEVQADINDSYTAPKEDQYSRRKSPVLLQDSVPDRRTKQNYNNFGVGSAVTTGKETSENEQREVQGIGRDGYAVQSQVSEMGSAGEFQRRRVDPQIAESPQNNTGKRNDAVYNSKATTQRYGGYAVRSAGGRDITQAAVPETSNEIASEAPGYPGYEQPKTISVTKNLGESYNGYEVRSPGKSKQKNESIYADEDDSYGGYIVKSAGGERDRGYIRQSETYYDDYNNSDRTSRLYRLYEGTKYYDRKGQRTSLSASKANGIVIIMPKEGKSVIGTVIKDQPMNSIIIETPQGVEKSYRYDDIDSLMGI